MTMQSTIDAGNTYRNPNPDIFNGGTLRGQWVQHRGSGPARLGRIRHLHRQPRPGPAGQLRRSDPDHAPSAGQPRHRIRQHCHGRNQPDHVRGGPTEPRPSARLPSSTAPCSRSLQRPDRAGSRAGSGGTVDIGTAESGSSAPTLETLLQDNLSSSSPVAIQVNSVADAVSVVDAINDLPGTATGMLSVNLAPNTYGDLTVTVPSGVTLTISGTP